VAVLTNEKRMSYHRRGLGQPSFTPTTAFAQAMDPYAGRQVPAGSLYAPYGWGPDFMVGMPMNYTHHIGYERTPVPGARRIGPMYDQLSGARGFGNYETDYRQLGDSGDGLGDSGGGTSGLGALIVL
jgi:hypothetical protein